ncbi:DUF924 family protein [Arenimonas sp.]|uniref:DUF924 family protein n=1 Tax=Arenimonas sp. TaxID=1872635 RepID=UPI0039E2419E
MTREQVLSFWFDEIDPKSWWSAEPAFDGRVRELFLPTLERAAAGECSDWRASPEGRLAEIIVLDQFSRNIHRGTPLAFAQDPMALALSQEAVAAGVLETLTTTQCAFLLMPYMHSESRAIHALAETLFAQWAPGNNHDYELRHKAIIDRFGRYPHRNAILGRESTADELAFLQRPGSSF